MTYCVLLVLANLRNEHTYEGGYRQTQQGKSLGGHATACWLLHMQAQAVAASWGTRKSWQMHGMGSGVGPALVVHQHPLSLSSPLLYAGVPASGFRLPCSPPAPPLRKVLSLAVPMGRPTRPPWAPKSEIGRGECEASVASLGPWHGKAELGIVPAIVKVFAFVFVGVVGIIVVFSVGCVQRAVYLSCSGRGLHHLEANNWCIAVGGEALGS
ncbi:hypothetical protein BC826DRAFT_966085 [Russula brevipes]|nr:hypothetical protein BC826DRAFT_966085 [Russula brevipes]